MISVQRRQNSEKCNGVSHFLRDFCYDLYVQEEIRARLSAEQQLKEAETSLKHLECAVQNQTPNIEADIKEEMTVNVKKLKRMWCPSFPYTQNNIFGFRQKVICSSYNISL